MRLTPPEKVGKLQTALHAKAKAAPSYRFYLLYDKLYRWDVLVYALPVEMVGGAHDGGLATPGFSLDLQSLRAAFARVDAFAWDAHGTGSAGADFWNILRRSCIVSWIGSNSSNARRRRACSSAARSVG